MLASGLPVVSTRMRPMVDLTEGLVVVDNATDFRETLRDALPRRAFATGAGADGRALPSERLRPTSFDQVLGSLAEIVAPDAAPASHMDAFITEWRRHLRRRS